MTQTMTKEFLTAKGLLTHGKSMFVISGDFGTITLNELLEEYAQQQLSAERERARKLIGALNEYIVLLGEELYEVMGFVNAHQWKSTRFEKGEELRQKIKQTLNEYDTATKES